MRLADEFISIITELNREKVNYALIGGLAMAYYDQPRFTEDIDILILPEEYQKVADILKKLDYKEQAEPWVFNDTSIEIRRLTRFEGEDFVMIDVLIGHDKEVQDMVHRAFFEEGDQVGARLISKDDLIALKKGRNSDQDKADIKRLTDAQN